MIGKQGNEQQAQHFRFRRTRYLSSVSRIPKPRVDRIALLSPGLMSPPLPRRRSLAVLAVVALGMVLLSYTVVLLIAALCVYLPYLLLMSSDSPGLQTLSLL